MHDWLVVRDHKDNGELPDAGEIHGFIDVAFRGRAIAEHADYSARLPAQDASLS
jgi:hypothetical protein